MPVVKKVVNFARCCLTDITLLVLGVLQIKTSVIAPKISFWCLWNTPVSLVPRMVPTLQWDTVIMGQVSDWRVTVSKEINDNLSFEERDSKRMPHTFAMSKSSALRYFCHTHQSTTLSHVHFCDDFGFILRGGKKRLSTLGNQLKGTVICQIVNQVPALMRIMSIFAANYRVTWVFSHLPNSKPGVNARQGV